MAIRTLAVLLLLVRPAAALTFKTVDTFTVKGAHGLPSFRTTGTAGSSSTRTGTLPTPAS